ncbi:MAG: hypothetical protein ACRDIE_00595, partial [Chloroflexota bacterium]
KVYSDAVSLPVAGRSVLGGHLPMNLYSLPDLKWTYACLHHQDLLACMKECHSRRLAGSRGGFGPLIGAVLIALGRATVSLGEWVRGVVPAGGRG